MGKRMLRGWQEPGVEREVGKGRQGGWIGRMGVDRGRQQEGRGRQGGEQQGGGRREGDNGKGEIGRSNGEGGKR